MGGFTHRCNVVVSLLTTLYCIQGVLATSSPYLIPGFEFNYDSPDQSLSIPVTSQCQRIRLRWTRTANTTGHSPVAPYFLQVFSSAASVPYVVPAGFGPTFDWDVPFNPNTQYQICMYDVNGVSGGCQQTYSMIANATAAQPTCQNVTAPSALSVSATVPNGAMFQYSYIDQCNSLSVTPTAGSPPFVLSIAPDFHPPYNITSNSMNPISWLVTLPVGFRFFISLESADGLRWANGPMRVGGSGPSNCLVPGTVSKSFFQEILIGASLGSALFGVAVGILGFIFFKRVHRRRSRAASRSYLSAEYASRNNSTKPLRAGSITPSSVALFSPTATSIPIPPMPAMPIPSTPPSRSSDLPLELVRPLRPSRRSADPYRVDTESVSSRSQSNSHFPLDVKRPLVSNQDDTASLASSSSTPTMRRPMSIQSKAPTYVPRSQDNRGMPTTPTTPGTPSSSSSLHRSPSAQSRAPTYVPRSSNLRGVIAVNGADEEDEGVPDLPPEYGRHTTDPSLNYAPSVLSSGNRF
ncbi:hypothetical protein GALMADRAFT_231683 [Galerina marginata CBS 339.88]|uniref:Fibronectin type-III domain-containing protein n=1 Tax=Galerina marginata (strain CBS 339.88) TaxID=685588 RepID=A0A067SCR2_GALM3|nr:hypothetical protein GALMADRAFT_231683 [Galerina marginata CBS 339.88]